MKTTAQKRTRDEFAQLANGGRVVLTSNWLSGKGKYSTVRTLPAGVRKIDRSSYRKTNKTLQREIEKFAKNRREWSFLIIEDMREFNKD